MSRRDRRRRRRQAAPRPPAPPRTPDELSAGFAALRAAALGLLLAGLTDDGRLGTEAERIINAGTNATLGVLGFMVAHASDDYEHKHGSREAAIDAVTAELAAMVHIAEGGQP